MLSQINNLSDVERQWNMKAPVWKDILEGNISIVEVEGVVMYSMHFDFHANMVVLGKECYIIAKRKDKCFVSAFVDDVGLLPSVSVVGAVLAYDYPLQAVTILMVFKNALYISTMKHNLMAPFILSEAGIMVNEVPKIHCENPTSDDHTI